VLWKNGIRPAERYYWLDDQYSYAMYSNKSGNSNYLTGNKNTEPMISSGSLDWVGVRNLFFVSALVPGKESNTTGSELIPIQPTKNEAYSKVHEYLGFGEAWMGSGPNSYARPDYPAAFDLRVGFISDSSLIDFDTFIAPLNYSLIKQSDIKNLDDIMTLGGSILKPISKFIINSIQFLQNQLPFLGVGLILVLFAFLVRLVSGPLTKMSLKSTQKMQEIQPVIKKIQEKHKSDPKVMQMKIMEAYKSHNVNPLSGCLVMFLQWPIMIPPFIVFRSVVDFRGESFLWIKDLSEPDYLISLPFHVPLLGTGEGWTGIGILPVLMGITLFLTMKKTMASMEGQNKVMMYGMNAMFVVLFNGFPAALNLYYVVYNLLNYLQQTKKDGGSSFFSKLKTFYKTKEK
jgi:YidC/Oxa1 family membrane protein insertase